VPSSSRLPGLAFGRPGDRLRPGSWSRVDTGFRGGWLCPPAPIHLVGLRRATAGMTVHDRRLILCQLVDACRPARIPRLDGPPEPCSARRLIT